MLFSEPERTASSSGVMSAYDMVQHAQLAKIHYRE